MITVEKGQGRQPSGSMLGQMEIGSIVVNYVHTISFPVYLLLAAYGALTSAISLLPC